MAQKREILRQIVAQELGPEEERAALETLAETDPPSIFSVSQFYMEQKNRYKTAFEELKREQEEMMARLRQTPWHRATFIDFFPGATDRALVAVGSSRTAVLMDSGVNAGELNRGDTVFLNHDRKLLIAAAPEVKNAGAVGFFSRFHDGRAVLKYRDEEIMVDLTDEARQAKLSPGDLLLYDQEALFAFEHVEKESEHPELLEETPDVRLEDIGGLDDLLEEIIQEMTLHFFHPELVQRHSLKSARGMVLSGPPGVGKTMTAKGVANHVSHVLGVNVTFLNIKPGGHRSMWFGQTEERIGRMFSQIKKSAEADDTYVMVFFDDFDHFGSRSDNTSSPVDARVLPRLLHEIDNLDPSRRILLIGATNRPDLLDEALLRPERFGDKVFRIPRPNREMAGDIFRKHLTRDLPFWSSNGASSRETAEAMIETALATLYSPNGENAHLATLTFRDGSRSPVLAAHLISGAVIANAVANAKRKSCFRALNGEPVGVSTTDLLAALSSELSSIVTRLRPGPALQQLLELPPDRDVVKLAVDRDAVMPKSYEYTSG